MKVFVDTSAFLAIMEPTEQNHEIASRVWFELTERDAHLICTNYVLLETLTLIQNRLGMSALRSFRDLAIPFLTIIWIDKAIHQAGLAAVLSEDRRQLSMVDSTSFAAMRENGLDTALAFDRHFEEQGFVCLN